MNNNKLLLLIIYCNLNYNIILIPYTNRKYNNILNRWFRISNRYH